MAYKFFKSTTKRSYKLVNGVSVAFELTSDNKDNVFVLTDIYRSSYKHPINIGLVNRIGHTNNAGFGNGTRLSTFYMLDARQLNESNKLIMSYSNYESEDFIYEKDIDESTKKYISRMSEKYVLMNNDEILCCSKTMDIKFMEISKEGFENIFVPQKIIYKGNESYELTLMYDEEGRLIKIENDALEKETVEITYDNNTKHVYFRAYKNFVISDNDSKTLLETIDLTLGINSLNRVQKSLHNSSSYQYDVTHTFGEDNDENQYLEYIDNILGESTKLYLSGGTTGSVTSIRYPSGKIWLSYGTSKTTVFVGDTYEEIFYFKDGTLSCIKNSEGLIKTYSYKETFYLNDYKKLNVESFMLHEVASKNGEIIEGTLRGLLFNETSSSVDAPSGRKARVLKFNEYDTSTEDGIDYFTFNVSGGKFDTFSALLYLKTKSRPSSLASINVSFMMKFKNKSGELIYSTVMNSIDVNIRDGVNWYEQLIIGQAPSSFESVEIEMMNTNAYGEELYFDIALYKENLGSSYNYDVNGNLFRMLKGKEVTSVKKSPNNRVEGSLHVVNSFDEEGRLIKTVDANNTTMFFDYDDYSNVKSKSVSYSGGYYERESFTYENGEHLSSRTKDGIKERYKYDSYKRNTGSSFFEDNSVIVSTTNNTVNYINNDDANYGNVESFAFQRGINFEKNYINYDNKTNVSKYYDSADTNRVYEFSYDSLNRLTSIKYDNKIVVLYKYDEKGNVSSYHYSDSDREIRNVYNYSVNNVDVPYGAITSIYQDYYNEEEDYSEELYRMTYSNKKLTASLNKSNGLLDGYEYEYDKLKSIKKIENNVNLFTQDIRYNHFDQNDKSIIKVGNDKIVNIISDSNNIINKNIVALDYLLMAKDDCNLFWTFFVPRATTKEGVEKDISNSLINVEKNIDSNTELEEVSYVDDGLRNFSVPYSNDGLVYDLTLNFNCTMLISLDIPSGNGELFKIVLDPWRYLSFVKENENVVIKLYSSGALFSQKVISKNLLGQHIFSINSKIGGLPPASISYIAEIYIDGMLETTISDSTPIYFTQLVLNGFNSSTNNKYNAIIIRKGSVFTNKELLEYIDRINEVYENRNIENKQSVISYNEEEYEYDEIVFNNTFTSRNGIKPLVQKNNDSFYSVRENFEFVPSLRRDGVGDNVYAIKGQELVYDFELDESGTVALRYKSISDKAVTLLQLKNNDLNIVVKKTEANTLKVFVNNVEKTSLVSNDDSFENLIVTWSKVVASSSLESYLYNVNVYRNGSRIVSTSISAVSSTAVMKVYLGNDSDTELLNGELLGYIDKLVYTDVEVNASKALEISEHLSHSGYCYNQYDFASRPLTKVINTSSDHIIKRNYTYNYILDLVPDTIFSYRLSRFPTTETLSVDNIVEEVKTYTYDDYKRVTNVECNDENISYTYDKRGYLTRVVDGSTTYTYDYDNLGNLIYNNGVQFGYQGQLLREYGTKTINYNGMYPINEVENGSIIKTYGWLGSKLRGIVSDKTYIFDYNARGIRERKLIRNGIVPISDIYYFYDSQNRLVGESRYEYIGAGQKTKTSDIIYIYDATGLLYGFRYNGVEYYYDRDILGNINHIINSNGLIVATYKYEAYGKHKVLNASGVEVLDSTFIGNINPIRYKGYYYDVETQLYWVSSRYYSPELCRWISPDSIEYLDPQSINGLNLYAYCGNDPINKYDPTGHSAILIALAIGAVLGGIYGGISAAANGQNVLAGIAIGAVVGGVTGLITEVASVPLMLLGTFAVGAGGDIASQMILDGKSLGEVNLISAAWAGVANAGLALVGKGLSAVDAMNNLQGASKIIFGTMTNSPLIGLGMAINMGISKHASVYTFNDLYNDTIGKHKQLTWRW